MKQRLAIIGSGISGLTCAYHLHDKFDLTLYEAANYVGGHTHTASVEHRGEKARVDTGFIVFNDRTYPNFMRLMQQIGVGWQKTEMSFSVRNDELGLEYNGGSLGGLFAQLRNVFNPQFWRLLKDIFRFNREVRRAAGDPSLTLGDFLARSSYGSLFADNYLLPMVSAIWSMGLAGCRDFPLAFFVRFFDNHGLLDLVNRPQWFTINGGSSSYIAPLTSSFADRILLNTPVESVQRLSDGIEVRYPGGSARYDQVIMACHGDQALRLLDQPGDREREIMSAFSCSENQVILHTDETLLPRARRAWASWNYRMIDGLEEKSALTYNMNILQNLNTNHTYLVSLNQQVREEAVLARFSYRHPIYTVAAVKSQERWREISGQGGVHYCGAYWRNGFHEDGVFSALRVCNDLGVQT